MELSRLCHPDKFPEDPDSAEARFARLKQAYDKIRSEDARARTDKTLGGTDFFTRYMTQGREVIQDMLMLQDDPDAPPPEAGVDQGLLDQGLAVVKYYHYKLPFAVPDGRLRLEDVDNIYALSDVFPKLDLLLAEWRPGDCHVLRPGDE